MLQQLKMKMVLIILLVCGFIFTSQVQASTVTTIDDNWINWPGYTSSKGDEIGNPKLDKIRVTVGDNNILQKVELLWRPNSGSYTRIKFDSLFINSYDITTTNTDWDDWDYLVHDGGSQHMYTGGSLSDVVNGDVPGDGLWRVKANYQYTTAKHSGTRVNNPNGIDANYLENQQSFSSNITWDSSNGSLTYNLASYGIDAKSGLFVAYAPYCANDVIGGHVSAVPLPASAYLFVTGFLGLIGYGRKKRQV